MNMHNRPFLCLVAGQRSGSTALRTSLIETHQFHDFGEVFQHSAGNRIGSFHHFAESRALPLADLVQGGRMEAITDEYLDHLQGLAGGRIALIDVKLNAWSALRAAWSYPGEEPLLMKRLRQRGAGFLFLARRDLTAQIVSERIAQETSIWHDLKRADVPGPVVVAPDDVLRRARLILQAERILLGHLVGHDPLLALWYEDLFVNGAVAPQVADWLNHSFGLALRGPLWPGLTRNKVGKSAVVPNYRALKRAVEALVVQEGRIQISDLP
jgi:hypothetical protein